MPCGYRDDLMRQTKEKGKRMASKSPEFLATEVIEIEDGHKDAAEMELALTQNMNADLMLMLMGDDQYEGSIPLFYFHEGNA